MLAEQEAGRRHTARSIKIKGLQNYCLCADSLAMNNNEAMSRVQLLKWKLHGAVRCVLLLNGGQRLLLSRRNDERVALRLSMLSFSFRFRFLCFCVRSLSFVFVLFFVFVCNIRCVHWRFPGA